MITIYVNDYNYEFHNNNGGNAADIGTIFVLQKKAVRAIYKMGPRESLKDKFKDVKIMTLYSQYIFENLIHLDSKISYPLQRGCVLNVVLAQNVQSHGLRIAQTSILEELKIQNSPLVYVLKAMTFGPCGQEKDCLERLITGRVNGKRSRGRIKTRCIDSV
ncbi:jg1456 [Pararge aegeria aegeria]|uniref:Jg1456 protein n=1 Tax=Pararge aegeria aegeria TaxID=348720 RepID=A0A8S4QKL2_9NEOP|nr:jg1456 [Pararge aegeria aegeria]